MEGLNQSQALEKTPFYNPVLSDCDTWMSSRQQSMVIKPIKYDNQVEYDDLQVDPFSELVPAGVMQEVLSKSVNSMTARAKEGKTLTGNILALIDEHNSAPNYATLSVKQAEAFKSFCNGLVKVVARHFDTYLCDKSVSTTDNASPPSRKAQKTAQTYANAASQASNRQSTGFPTATAPKS